MQCTQCIFHQRHNRTSTLTRYYILIAHEDNSVIRYCWTPQSETVPYCTDISFLQPETSRHSFNKNCIESKTCFYFKSQHHFLSKSGHLHNHCSKYSWLLHIFQQTEKCAECFTSQSSYYSARMAHCKEIQTSGRRVCDACENQLLLLSLSVSPTYFSRVAEGHARSYNETCETARPRLFSHVGYNSRHLSSLTILLAVWVLNLVLPLCLQNPNKIMRLHDYIVICNHVNQTRGPIYRKFQHKLRIKDKFAINYVNNYL